MHNHQAASSSLAVRNGIAKNRSRREKVDQRVRQAIKKRGKQSAIKKNNAACRARKNIFWEKIKHQPQHALPGETFCGYPSPEIIHNLRNNKKVRLAQKDGQFLLFVKK